MVVSKGQKWTQYDEAKLTSKLTGPKSTLPEIAADALNIVEMSSNCTNARSEMSAVFKLPLSNNRLFTSAALNSKPAAKEVEVECALEGWKGRSTSSESCGLRTYQEHQR